jgi:hypothetical protein
MKKCAKRGGTKDVSEFRPRKDVSGGHRAQCKSRHNTRQISPLGSVPVTVVRPRCLCVLFTRGRNHRGDTRISGTGPLPLALELIGRVT